MDDFAALLAAGAESLGGGLPETLRAAREALPHVSNIGRSRDRENAYQLIDGVVLELQQVYPESLCAKGCSQCCELHRALMRIHRSEWDVMHDHLVATLDPDQLEALVDRFYATYTPYLPLLHDIQRCIDEGKRPKLQPQELPLFCPILEDGACLAYPVRPAICRGYGHFQLTNPEGDDQAIFACRDQETVLKKQLGDGAGPRAELPSFNPFYQAIATLCDGEEKLLIPLWFERAFPRPE